MKTSYIPAIGEIGMKRKSSKFPPDLFGCLVVLGAIPGSRVTPGSVRGTIFSAKDLNQGAA